ncbi:uncharacterized protein LOC100158789 [Acyrthosiphon pisum]|uniref:Uncharacterized protein n=1 Tax=Acyrthosiphon pisum TaxID=7029 RepID=A0A8R1TEG0_ACYPI|nr:uncharacterized protein LOC100158789 [Acyrthosiphon pisum]|eukprot:NP_001155914.1 uncharacterized protein LOC100158789 [Acyrthosiphon pisum]
MIFFKQYSMMITFIVIAVWVMPAITSELAVLCTTLYETGRLITIYKDIPLEEDAIIGIFKRMTQWNIEQAASEQEKAVVIAVAKTLKVNFDITGSAIKRIENNKARLADKADGSVGTQKPPTVKDILNAIAEKANNDEIKNLNSQITDTEKHIKTVLINLGRQFANFVTDNYKLYLPMVGDFCKFKSRSDEYVEFYKSVFKIDT